jgi:hypothetical protein
LRALLVSEAELWPWSSAASHCGARADDESFDLKMWRGHWTAPAWREYLGEGEMESKLAVIRRRTHTGRAVGTARVYSSRARKGDAAAAHPTKARAHEKSSRIESKATTGSILSEVCFFPKYQSRLTTKSWCDDVKLT